MNHQIKRKFMNHVQKSTLLLFIFASIPLSTYAPTAKAQAENNPISTPNLPQKPTSPPGIEYFETHIRPVLAKYCYKCHSTTSKKVKGGLTLDLKSGWTTGGDSGPAITPGDPDNSLLIQSIRYKDPDLEMPPKKKLPDDVIQKFEKWVQMGAPDPRSGQSKVKSIVDREIDINKGRLFWSFKPVKVTPPKSHDDDKWSTSKIDQYLYDQLKTNNLSPNKDADKLAFIRRLSIDLTGLPPSEQEIYDYVADKSPEAKSRLIDRLINSQRFGERWGQHWLDVARFAESSGGGRSLMFKNAWRFRDYVIKSFNQDKPFNQFIKEQIAGDLMLKQLNESDAIAKRPDYITATGYLMLGPINYELQDKELLNFEVVDEQITVVGRSFLGMTMGCARCHDHMFDPIPMADYYAMAGIFKNTLSVVDGNVSGYVEQEVENNTNILIAHMAHAAKLKDAENNLKQAKTLLAVLKKDKSDKIPATQNLVNQLTKQLTTLKNQAKNLPEKAKAMSVKDRNNPKDFHILIRGEIRKKGADVKRGFITVACATDQEARPDIQNESGRLALANWIASEKNPLTSRVMVNRIWRQLFGVGIVRTVDNFGHTGERPTHPELLDYLAHQFTTQGWSVKRIIREIVSSRAYGIASNPNPHALKIDPENRLLWRAHRRRMDAETLRDTILFVADELDWRRGGRTIRKLSTYDLGYEFNTKRRSIYVPRFRNSILEIFSLFDSANPNMVTGNRNTSTLPTQSLYMMNSQFVMNNAEKVTLWLLSRPDILRDEDRIDSLYLRLFGRSPSDAELINTLRYLVTIEKHPDESDIAHKKRKWTLITHGLISSLDFRYY